ncbi:MAG: hypothetical protein H6686_10310 [Fibrobacteria bacterium]|nr:hypothetical protein [Fibrobacteria bacterium]
MSRIWQIDGDVPLAITHSGPNRWKILEQNHPGASRPDRSWIDESGAFCAPFRELEIVEEGERLSLRWFRGHKVLLARGGELELPSGWWSEESPAHPAWPWAMGSGGARPEDAERLSRGLWSHRIPNPDGGTPFRLVRNWSRQDPHHGDRPWLHQVAAREGEKGLRERLRGYGGCGVLDLRVLDLHGMGAEDLSDLFLFLHQAYGAIWLGFAAPPSPVLLEGISMASMDSQGDLAPAWILERPVEGREIWKERGPCLVPCLSGMDPDCYVWVQ